MRVSSILFAVLGVVLVISLLCIWFYPSMQDFMASNTMWNGLRSFNSEFEADNIDSLDDLPELPDKAVLVAIPYLDYSDEELSKIKRFVDNGGTLLLMNDYGYGNSVLTYLGVSARFTNKPLLDPLFCYKNPSIPLVTDFAPGLRESGIDVIMLNHATALTNVMDSEATAFSSSASFLDVNENGSWDQDEPKGPFVVAAELQVGKGMLVLVSDPSIVISAMIGRDNNYDFIRYLAHYTGEQGRLFVDRSHLIQTPLDVSKARLVSTREALASPYALLGIIAIIFVAVSGYTLKKEKTIG